MYIYYQSTGIILHNGDSIGTGYSGYEDGKNNPDAQYRHNIGPIPRGLYFMGRPYDSDTHGPLVIPLTPSDFNEMFGRDEFLIHGDSIKNPGRASKGCIILDHETRLTISNQLPSDNLLGVV